jgi:hypothetical protein
MVTKLKQLNVKINAKKHQCSKFKNKIVSDHVLMHIQLSSSMRWWDLWHGMDRTSFGVTYGHKNAPKTSFIFFVWLVT